MSRITNLLDVLKVEIEQPQAGLRNLLANPSGDLGAWAWATGTGVLTSGQDQFSNPGFEVNTTGWLTTAAFNVNAGGTLTRDVVEHDSGVASGKVVTTGAAGGLQGAYALVTVPALTTVTFSARVKATAGRPVQMRARDVTNGVSQAVTAQTAAVGAGWVTLTVTLTTGAATASVQVSLTTDATAGVSTFYIDSLASSLTGAYLEFQTSTLSLGPYSEFLPVTPGQYISASWYTISNDALFIRAWFYFYDATDTQVGSGSLPIAYSAAVDQRFAMPPILVPAGVVSARLVFQPASTGAGAAPAAGKKFRFRQAVVATAATAAALGPVYTNRATNPSFVNAAHGWTIYQGTGALAVVAGGIDRTNRLQGTNTGAKFGIQSPEAQVIAGTTYSVGIWTALPATTYSIYVAWYTAAHVLISSALVGSQLVGGTRPRIDALAPTGAVFARIQVTVTGGTPVYVDAWHIIDAPGVTYFDGGTPDVAGIDYAWTGTAETSTSTKSLSNLPYIPPITYQEIQGSAVSLGLQQRTFDCTLSMTIRDATLDPASANLIRPGRAVRVSTLTAPLGVWKPFFQGKAARPSVDYGDLKRGARPTITLSAYGPGSELANTPRPFGVATIAELPAVLEGVRIPFKVNGLTDQVIGYTTASSNDQASALDQVILTRDSQSGYAWVARDGILRAYTSRNVDYYSTGYAAFVEGDYTTLGLSYDTEKIINQVTVILLRYNATTGETEEVTYGPYVDDTSIREWGPGPAEFRVQGAVIPATYAAAVLAANSVGAQRVENLRVPITDTDDLTPLKALIDLYALATVQNVDRGILVEQRVQGIDHTITWTAKNGPRWYMDLLFQGVDDAATPLTTPPAGQTAVTDGTWADLALTAPYTNPSPATKLQSVRQNGVTYIRGFVTRNGAASGATVAVLPPGQRPGREWRFTDDTEPTATTQMRCVVGSDGTIKVYDKVGAFTQVYLYTAFPAEA